jgi:STAS domain
MSGRLAGGLERVPGLCGFSIDGRGLLTEVRDFARGVADGRVNRAALVAEPAPPVRWVVVAAEPITDVDTTAADTLGQLLQELRQQQMTLAFAELKDPVKDRLSATACSAPSVPTGSSPPSAPPSTATSRPPAPPGSTGRSAPPPLPTRRSEAPALTAAVGAVQGTRAASAGVPLKEVTPTGRCSPAGWWHVPARGWSPGSLRRDVTVGRG